MKDASQEKNKGGIDGVKGEKSATGSFLASSNGLQPALSDTEEFQAEGREGGKVPGGREAQNKEGGSGLRFVVKGDGYMRKEDHMLLKQHLWGCTLAFLLGCNRLTFVILIVQKPLCLLHEFI